MPTTKTLPEVEGLFTPAATGEPVRLRTGTCAECGSVFFPSHAELHRPNCSGGPVEAGLMEGTGTVVSYTVQHYVPPEPYPAPAGWEPVAIATVVFAEQGLQVPGQLVGVDPADLAVGLVVETVAATLYVDDDGAERQTWKFRPVPADENGAA